MRLPTALLAAATSSLASLALAQTPPPPAGPAAATEVTFTEHVAPIVFQHCAGCHRPGEVAPFPLLSYQDVRKKGRMLQQVTADRYMPPWHPEPGHGSFRGENRLTDAQIGTIAQWVKTGMKEGPKEALPALPQFADGWQLGEPDLIVKMLDPFEVPAKGPDIYRNFVVPIGLPEDRWVTAIEVRPSARSVLHHVLFFLDEDGEAQRLQQESRDRQPGFPGMRLRRAGSLGGWAVGGMPEHLPEGLAMKLPKGSDLVLQSHFHPAGRKEKEQTTIGLYFAKQPPARTLAQIQLPPLFGIGAGLDIPAGQKDFRIGDEFELPCDVDAVSVGGHAHMLCTSMRMFAELPDGKKEPLLLIRDWDFNWQNRYTYQSLVRLPKGAKLKAELLYDNSKDNPDNPHNPPKRVRWGRESTDEMGSITLLVTPADEQDRQTLLDAIAQHQLRGVVSEERMEQIQKRVEEQIKQWDKDKDGKVAPDEVPARMRRMFDRLDTDKDGFLTVDDFKNGGGLGGLLPGGLGGGELGGPGGGREGGGK